MKTNALKILILEDAETDAVIIQRMLLRTEAPYEFKIAFDRVSFVASVEEFKPDVILSDNALPQFSAAEALQIIQQKRLHIPFILVTGSVSDEFAAGIIKAGADDYILKDRLARLPVAIEAAVKQKKADLEKLEALEKLKQSEEKYREIVENITDIIYTHDLDGKILSTNLAAKQNLGYEISELQEMNILDLLSPAFKSEFDDYIKMIQQNCCANGIMHVQTKTGEKRIWEYKNSLTISGNAVKMVRGFAQDITERHKAERKLSQNEKRFRALVENNEGIIALLNKNMVTTFRSVSATRITGWTHEELDKIDPREFIHPDDLEKTLETFSLATKNPEVPFPVTVRVRHKKGYYLWLEGVIKNMTHDQAIGGIISNLRDITERKNADVKLLKANRLYALISQINQMIVRAKDQQIIFNEVCKIAIEIGKFRMAWIGLVDENTNHLIAVMHAGKESEYFSKIKGIAINDISEGSGPTGRAIREKKIVFCNDIENDAMMAPWREDCASRGYLSSIALPIKKFGKVIGAFSLYAGEKNFFDSEEIKLLEEATEDISFSLELFEKEELRKKAEVKVLESEQSYYTLAEILPIGIFKTDTHGSTTYVNSMWCTITGLSAEEALGSGWQKAVHEGDKSRIIDGWEKALVANEHAVLEYRMIRPDGSSVWVIGKAIPERNLENQLIGYVGTIMDITERKKAEDEVRIANERFDMIACATSDSLWDWDLETNVIWANEMHQQLYGRTLGDPVPTHAEWIKRIHSDDRDRASKNLENAKTSYCRLYTEEYRFYSENAGWINIYGRTLIERNKKGEPTRLIGSMMDITELKKAEAAIIDSEEKYRVLIEEASEGIFISDSKGRFITVNASACRLSQHTEKELLQMSVADFLQEDDLKEKPLQIDALKKGKTVVTERMMKQKDGNFTQLEITSKLLTDGRLLSLVRDISERKKAEAAILLSNERYNLVSRATHDSIWDLNILTNTTIRTGDGFKTLFGYENGSANDPEYHWSKLIHPEDIGQVIESQRLVFNNTDEYYWEQQYRFLKSDGNYAFVYDKGYIIRDRAGNAIRMIGAMQDITLQKENESNLIKLNESLLSKSEELAESNAELEQFAYVASHDMQEPLRMVTSFLLLLEKKYNHTIDDTGKKYIHFAVDGAKRMRQIIMDLLEFSRVGQNYIEPKELNLHKLIEDIQSLYKKQIEEKQAVILLGNLPVIIASESPIRQVFQNLISNALKYARQETPVRIQIDAIDLNDYWQFSVADNGIGISGEYYDKIFVIFQRLHNLEQFSGTGIGLAVTKKTIEKLGGKIWVQSTEGQGSTFYFTIKKTRSKALESITVTPKV